MANPTVSAIIPGARSATRAVQNAASIRSRIAPAFWSARKRDGLVEANAPVPA